MTTTTATYSRLAAPKGTKVTCPCCLKKHNAKTDGTLTRHGWKETGRTVGSYGNGYQWGECAGWDRRPLEQTDADALAIIDIIEADIPKMEADLEQHATTEQAYTHRLEFKCYSSSYGEEMSRARAAFTAEGADVLKGYIQVGRLPALVALWAIEPGAESRYASDGWGKVQIPSHAVVRGRFLAGLKGQIESAKAQVAALREAIATHRANPAPWTGEEPPQDPTPAPSGPKGGKAPKVYKKSAAPQRVERVADLLLSMHGMMEAVIENITADDNPVTAREAASLWALQDRLDKVADRHFVAAVAAGVEASHKCYTKDREDWE